MTSYSIDEKQSNQLENERRSSLARYLIHCDPGRQGVFLRSIKDEQMRNDIKHRMREELAKEIAALPENMRKLRLSRLQQRCNRGGFANAGFFPDILTRVKRYLKESTERNERKEDERNG